MSPLRRLLGFVRPYAGLSILSLVLLTLLVGLDLAIPRLVQRVIDEGIARHDRGEVVRTALVMLGISALSLLIAIGNNVFSVRVGEGVARDMREAIFLRIQRFSFGDLDRQKTGKLLVRLTSDVAAVKMFTQVALRIGTRAPLMMIGSLVLMIRTSPDLALRLLPLLAITTGLIVLFVSRMEPLYALVQQRLDAVNEVLHENVAGARLVKAFVRAEYEEERFGRVNAEMTERSIRVMRVMSLMTPALTLCINVGVVVVIFFGGLDAIRGALTIGELVAFSNYLLTTMTPLVMMTMLSNTWASGLASLRRIEEVLGTAPGIEDATDAIDVPEGAAPSVALADVTFRYAGERGEPVLRDVTLDAAPGKTIAILGATGAGKSTLVSLIPRFYDPSSGTVSAFGHDVRTLRQRSLVGRIGMVPQEALLFSGTVKDNIRYGRPTASDDEVIAAAKAAQAHDFVSKLPSGYDARVEARGANFSGGQKQRLSIARALLVDPEILILDDATSAVDVDTENAIQRALAQTATGRTTFVVAQRVSTVLDADTIVVIDKGAIVARGTHAELLASSSTYREIYDTQLGAGLPQEAGDA